MHPGRRKRVTGINVTAELFEKNFDEPRDIDIAGAKSSDPLAGVSAALQRVRTLYRHGRTCNQEVGCDFVAKIPVTIRANNATRYI